jgi:hypothetical protein
MVPHLDFPHKLLLLLVARVMTGALVVDIQDPRTAPARAWHLVVVVRRGPYCGGIVVLFLLLLLSLVLALTKEHSFEVMTTHVDAHDRTSVGP